MYTESSRKKICSRQRRNHITIFFVCLDLACTFTPWIKQHVDVILRTVCWHCLICQGLCYNREFVFANGSSWQGVDGQFDFSACLFNDLGFPAVITQALNQRNNHKCAFWYIWIITWWTKKFKSSSPMNFASVGKLLQIPLCNNINERLKETDLISAPSEICLSSGWRDARAQWPSEKSGPCGWQGFHRGNDLCDASTGWVHS